MYINKMHRHSMDALLILSLPACLLAQIKIEVTCENKNERTLSYQGNSLDNITHSEVKTFNLTDANLKRSVKKYFGLEPDDVFLNDPTTWGDLYATHNWKPVTRNISPHHIAVISFSSTPTLILTQVFNNTSTKKAQFKAPIRQHVNNTIRSSWATTGPLSIQEAILYKFNMSAPTFSGRLLATYTARWGENVMISESVTAGSEAAVQVMLSPKQTVVTDLVAMRYIIQVQISYIANLLGSLLVNYAKGYKGHHFWSLDINSVLEYGGMKVVSPSRETIVLDYYTDSKVIVRDYETKEILDTVKFDLHKT